MFYRKQANVKIVFDGGSAGRTWTEEVSKDGAAYAACAGAAVALTGTDYVFSPTAADTDAATLIFRLTSDLGTVYSTGNLITHRMYVANQSGYPDLETLLDMLRLRLGDTDGGAYTDQELTDCINTAYTRIQILTRCTIVSVAVTLLTTVSAYAVEPIFEPTVVLVDGVPIKRTTLMQLATSEPAVLAETGETPTKWFMSEGKLIEFRPIPTGSSFPAVQVWGPGVADPMSDDDEGPTALPAGFDLCGILDGAEYEARKMKLSKSRNAEIAPLLSARADAYIAQIKRTD